MRAAVDNSTISYKKTASRRIWHLSASSERREWREIHKLCLKSMEDFRSKSCGDGRMQMEGYHGGGGGGPSSFTGMQDLRCYSASYAYPPQTQMENDNHKFKKGKSANGYLSKALSFNDPELQRKKRVASYKVYAVQGKMKGSLKKSFRWLKDRYTRVIHGL